MSTSDTGASVTEIYPAKYDDVVDGDEISVVATAVPQIVRSGLKASGSGIDYSGWYYITSDDAPFGWQIVNPQFHLEGDRRCGAWAECAEVSHTYNHVVWKFRLQGHNEGAPYVRYSEGVLTYDLIPLPKGHSLAG